jgi:hypothetical protein
VFRARPDDDVIGLGGGADSSAAARAPLDSRPSGLLAVAMEPIRFAGQIRHWNVEKGTGLAVVDIPAGHVPALGGLKQQRVRGRIGSVDFTSSVMPAGGGRLALSISKAMMGSAGVAVGDTAELEISTVGRD